MISVLMFVPVHAVVLRLKSAVGVGNTSKSLETASVHPFRSVMVCVMVYVTVPAVD